MKNCVLVLENVCIIGLSQIYRFITEETNMIVYHLQNLRTAPQSKDQTLSRGNQALIVSAQTKQPIRVIRGFKLDNAFAPEEGYRYDGECFQLLN